MITKGAKQNLRSITVSLGYLLLSLSSNSNLISYAATFTATFLPESSATLPANTSISPINTSETYTSDTDNPSGLFHGMSCFFAGSGWPGASGETLDGAHLVYRVQLDFNEEVNLESISVAGVGTNRRGATIRLLDRVGRVIAAESLTGRNQFRIVTLNPGIEGRSFILEEFDGKGDVRFRDRVTVTARSLSDNTVATPQQLTHQGSVIVGPGKASGRIILMGDDWPLFDEGFRMVPTTIEFAENISAWFTRGNPGRFLSTSKFSATRGTGDVVVDTLTTAGHSWTVNDNLAFMALSDLLAFDALFLGDTKVIPDSDLLTDYVRQGGSVYLYGTGVGNDPSRWNSFLGNFGLGFGNPQSGKGVYRVEHRNHPIFNDAADLYYWNGVAILDTAPRDPRSQLFYTDRLGPGLIGIWDPDIGTAAGPREWPILAGGNGHYYEHVSGTLRWEEARAAASNRVFNGLSGHLVTITSAAENDFVSSLFPPLEKAAWIGANDIATEGNWIWSDGPEGGNLIASFTSWDRNEPNNTNNEDAAGMWGPGSAGGSEAVGNWNDFATQDTLSFFVEYSPDETDIAEPSSPETNIGQKPPTLLAYWDFNDFETPEQTTDLIHSYVGDLRNGLGYSQDRDGWSGQPGDRSLDFGTVPARKALESRSVSRAINIATRDRNLSISFWQKWNEAPYTSSTSFAIMTPNGRPFRAHTPWSDGSIYFYGPSCRVSGHLSGVTSTDIQVFLEGWRHFAFVKTSERNQVWIDGRLFIDEETQCSSPAEVIRLILGANQDFNNQVLAKIDDFSIFDEALSGPEVAELARGKSPIALAVPAPPKILRQPNNIAAPLGIEATFDVQATTPGSLPLKYQWFKDNLPIEGANQPILIVGVEESRAGAYHVRIQDFAGNEITSSSARLTVLPIEPLIISMHSSRSFLFLGDAVKLTIPSFISAQIKYQWFRDGVPLENETNPELTIESVSPEHLGEYTAELTYSTGRTVSSEPALLDAQKREQSITWNTVTEAVLGDPAVHVQAESSSGLEVTIEVVDGMAFFDGKNLHPKEGGKIRLKASQLGNEFYNAAPDSFHNIDVLLRPNIGAGEGGVVFQTVPSEAFAAGQVLLLVAIPDHGYVFSAWQGDLASTDNPLTLEIKDNVRVFATFRKLWPVSVEQSEGGRIAIHPELEQMVDGSILSVLALPDDGFRFDQWLGSLSGHSMAETLIVREAVKISAVFVGHRAPEIKSEFSRFHVEIGDDFTFEAETSGDSPISYRWSKDGQHLEGATEPTLSLNSVQSSDSGLYSLLASNETGESSLDLVDLRVLQPIVLVSQPDGLEQMAGSRIVLEVEVDGDAPISFQWSKNGEIVGDARGRQWVIESLQESDSGLYSVRVSNPISEVISNPIPVTVTPFIEAPVIAKAPQPRSIGIGSSLSLSVVNSGQAPFEYLWIKDGQVIASTTVPHLLLQDVQASQAGLYSVRISNSGGTVTSTPVEIRVLRPPIIREEPSGVQVMRSEPFSLRVMLEGGGNIHYQWFRDGVQLPGYTDSILKVEKAEFAQTGQYHVVAQTELGLLVSETVSVLVTPVILPPEIIDGPVSRSVTLGDSATFAVTATGTQPFTYTWFLNGSILEGATKPTLFIESVNEADLGSYRVEVANSQGRTLSPDDAILRRRTPVKILKEPEDQRAVQGTSLNLEFEIEGEPPYAIHWEHNGTIKQGFVDAALILPNLTAEDSGAYQLVITDGDVKIRSRIVDVEVLIPAVITSQPKDLQIVAEQSADVVAHATGTQPMTFQLWKDGKIVQENNSGRFRFSNVGSTVSGIYQFGVSNEAGADRSNPFNIHVIIAPPTIVEQTKSTRAVPGDRVELSIEATGGELGYRWFKDGDLLEGKDAAQLVIHPVTATSGGDYFAVVANSQGVITSAPITITLSTRLGIQRVTEGIAIRIDGLSGGITWLVETSSDGATWKPFQIVELERNGEFDSAFTAPFRAVGERVFFRAVQVTSDAN